MILERQSEMARHAFAKGLVPYSIGRCKCPAV